MKQIIEGYLVFVEERLQNWTILAMVAPARRPLLLGELNLLLAEAKADFLAAALSKEKKINSPSWGDYAPPGTFPGFSG